MPDRHCGPGGGANVPPDFGAGGRFGIIQGMPDASRHPAGKEPAHDILAAEAFAMPAPDPALRRSLVLPDDPTGRAEPHDILAAEEFAMPAPGPGTRAQRGPGRRARVGSWLGLAAAVLALKRALRQLRR